jgi:enolase
MKVIICNTTTGQYSIPMIKVAEDRANHYACDIDGYDKDSDEWKDEVNYAMDDNIECIDWLLNNTDWENWEAISTKINDKVKVTEDDFWCSSEDFEISEI